MERLCTRCRRLSEAERCEYCGSPELKEPEAEDLCYLTEQGGAMGSVLADALQFNGIAFRAPVSPFGVKRGSRVFFVPYGQLDDAWSEFDRLWNGSRPEANGSGSGLFSADEIDRMEAASLDEMDLEGLKDYRARIVRTLKEIKEQEKQWKRRAGILLDMKEEAECLIEDLS